MVKRIVHSASNHKIFFSVLTQYFTKGILTMKNAKRTAKSQAAKPVFFRRKDLIIIAVLLLAALIFYFVFVANRAQGGTAQITIRPIGGEQIVQEISLSEDRIITIEEAPIPVTLEVQGGRIRFIHSQCPDHVCENVGWLQHEGDEAVCLPAGVLVRVIVESDSAA